LIRHSKHSTLEAIRSIIETSGAVMSSLPTWLPLANKVVKVLNRLGLNLGTIQVLEVPGRTSGKPRATPVSPLRVDGREYVIAGLAHSQWARNVRAAGAGRFLRRRGAREVLLSEVTDPQLRREIMRAFPTMVPHGVQFFVRIGVVDDVTPEAFAAAADRVAAFAITPR
jgi:deazaflavin-dependent oxidoreductase (nitroreductase family)